MKNKKKIVLIISILLVSVLLIVGVTYAALTYTSTSTNQDLIVGDIWMKYEETNGISLKSAVPGADYSECFEFTITGKNTYTKKDIWYDIRLIKGDVPEGKTEDNRIEDKYLKFKLVEVDGDVETEIFTNRIYSDLTNKTIHAETISKGENSYTKTYRLYMVISEDLVIGNVEGAISSSEFENLFGSIKVATTGSFNEKEAVYSYEDRYNVSDESCFDAGLKTGYIHNTNMTDEELGLCVNYIKELGWEEYQMEGETIESFCDGTGTNGGFTFQQMSIIGQIFVEEDIKYFIENNIVKEEEFAVIYGYDSSCGSEVVIPKTINGYEVSEIHSSCIDESTLTPISTNKLTNSYSDNLIFKKNYNNNNVNPIGSAEVCGFSDSDIKSLVIPNTITIIGQQTFKQLNLESITFEENSKLVFIDSNAFTDNNLKIIEIPKSVIGINSYAFYQNKLESVTFEENSKLFTIKSSAFRGDNHTFKEIIIPDSVYHDIYNSVCVAFNGGVKVYQNENIVCSGK